MVIDESYSDYVIDDKFVSGAKFFREFPNVIILNSLSKNMGLSGWRIGYIIASESIINAILHLNRHLITLLDHSADLLRKKNFDKILGRLKPEIKELQMKREQVALELTKQEVSFLSGASTFTFSLTLRERF